MTQFAVLYDQFLSTVSDTNLSKLTDEEIKAELYNLAIKAIARFKFPQIKLLYTSTVVGDVVTTTFTNDVTQRELNVLLAHMKVSWIDFQISKTDKYQNLYYDSAVRTFSAGNLLAQLNRLHENFVKDAKAVEYDYGRVDAEGRARVGLFTQ